MDISKGYWIRLADGQPITVSSTHENAVRDNPTFYGVRGKPLTSFLRAALEAGWLRARTHAGEIIFEHAQSERTLVVAQIVRFVLRDKSAPETRIVVNCARNPKDNFATTAASILDPAGLQEILCISPKSAKEMLERARAAEQQAR